MPSIPKRHVHNFTFFPFMPDLPFTYDGKTTEEARETYAQDIHTGCSKFDYQGRSINHSSAE